MKCSCDVFSEDYLLIMRYCMLF